MASIPHFSEYVIFWMFLKFLLCTYTDSTDIFFKYTLFSTEIGAIGIPASGFSLY